MSPTFRKILSIFFTVVFCLPLAPLALGNDLSPSSRRCLSVFEFLQREKDLSWVTSYFKATAVRKKLRPSDIDDTSMVRMLPPELKEKLTTPNQDGFVKLDRKTLIALKNFSEKVIRQRLLNLQRAPDGLRQWDLWVHDKNGKEGSFAIRQLLKPDVGFFGVGHGRAGGNHHVVYPITIQDEALIRVEMDVDKIIELYSKLPGVKSSKVIFYKTCSGGLTDEHGEADAVRLARATGVPVIAPMGILFNRGELIGQSQRQWLTGVKDEHTRVLVPEEKAFRIFNPDGKSKPITFQQLKDLIIRQDQHSRVIYGD